MKISVIVPAFNEEENIGTCLQALQAQTLAKEDFEVIVVDNGSTDATAERANLQEAGIHLRVVSHARMGISEARNFGASLGNGDVLAFLDADCISNPNWLEEALKVAPQNCLWGAHYLIPDDATWIGKIWFQYQATEHEGHVSFIPAGSLLMRRAEFNRIGGFNIAAETSEDVEICDRARSFGMDVIAFPSLAVVHMGTPRTLQHFYKQNRWHGKHVVPMFFSRLPSLKHLPIVALSLYTLLMLGVAVVLTGLALLHPTAKLALIAWLMLLLPSLLLAVKKTAASRRPQDTPRIFILYLAYFLARADAAARMVFGL